MSISQLSTQSAAARRAAETELRGLIAKFVPEHLRLVGSVRRWLQKRLPTAHEVVYEYENLRAVVISFSPNEHGNQGVFGIRASADGVKLYFNQGKGLPDPEKLLRGSANARWIQVEGAASLKRAAVVSLVEEAITRNKVPFARTGRGPVVIRSTSATKSRPRRPG